MKRKHKIELVIVSVIILANSAFLVYQFCFNRKFLYEQGRLLCEQGQHDEAVQRYVKFLKRYREGDYVEDARREFFCKALPNAATLLDLSDVAVATEAFRNSKSQWVKDMAELALIHTGMEASIKPGGKYDAFLNWWNETVGDIGRPPGMVLAPAGEFTIGSPEDEKDRALTEGPQHLVHISRALYIGKFEVTQQHCKAIMGENPSRFKGASNPVENVSWRDSVVCDVSSARINSVPDDRLTLASLGIPIGTPVHDYTHGEPPTEYKYGSRPFQKDVDEIVDLYEKGMEAYHRGGHPTALGKLQACLNKYKSLKAQWPNDSHVAKLTDIVEDVKTVLEQIKKAKRKGGE